MLKRHTCISEDTCHVKWPQAPNSGVLAVTGETALLLRHACLCYFITPLLANPRWTKIDKIRWAPQMIIRLRNYVQHPKETNTRILKSHVPAQELLQGWQKTCWPSPLARQGKQCFVRGWPLQTPGNKWPTDSLDNRQYLPTKYNSVSSAKKSQKGDTFRRWEINFFHSLK